MWHFMYVATIELAHNPSEGGDSADAKRLGNELERAIRQIPLTGGYRIAAVKVRFEPEDNSRHLP